jgi:putative endonuclease
MTEQRKNTGILGEQLARNFLKKKGYRILETNYRCRQGEIDIIARQKDCLVFVEVRTRTSLEYGAPEESISSNKIKHLERAIYHYLQCHRNLPENWRADLVAVELDSGHKVKRIEITEDAFEV